MLECRRVTNICGKAKWRYRRLGCPPDWTGILPALLTASILFNIRCGWPIGTLKEISTRHRVDMYKGLTAWSFRLLLQAMTLNLGLSAFVHGMPPALMIYWITSTNVATVQNYVLDKYMFARPPLKTWKKIYVGHSRLSQDSMPSSKK